MFEESYYKQALGGKINIIEGCDGVGKTTFIKCVSKYAEDKNISLKVLRFPDNHMNVPLRNIILSEELSRNTLAQLFLFLADFVYTFESEIKPHLESDTIFIFDRFIPSTSVYQGLHPRNIESIFDKCKDICNISFGKFYEFYEVMKNAEYIYLHPSDIDAHKSRLSKKTGDEINHLDPVGHEAIMAQIGSYYNLANYQKEHGILSSRKVTILQV